MPGSYNSSFNSAVSGWNYSSAGTYITVGAVTTNPYHIKVYVGNYGNVSWSGQVDSYICNSFSHTWDDPPRLRLNQYWTDGYAEIDRIGVFTHEFGHAIGLGHVAASCGSNATMVPDDQTRAACGFQYPQSDDVTGVSDIYPSWK